MFELTFDANRCLTCPTHDCLTRCQYLDIDDATAKIEIQKIINKEDSFVLHDCATCYACEEYCKRGNHPFYLIVQRQEEMGISPLPEPLVKRGIQLAIPFRGEPEIYDIEGPALNLGVFSDLSNLTQGKLFEGLTPMSIDPRKMFHYFCQLMYLHYGKVSVINEGVEKTLATIAAHKVKEVVHFHDECYGTYTSYAPAFGIDVPFKSIHLFEYLYNRLLELKDEIKPLNMTVAYQRPCSSRLSSDKYKFVEAIFDLIGVTYPERQYSGENAICCAGTILGQKKKGSRQLAMELQEKNLEDMKQVEAQVCVFNCPACMTTLGRKVAQNGMMPMFMSDLCRMAIGEQPS